ncbi:hypothetical protein [Nocardia cyriacigeorgica]|uniref:hypothetical protein n=1 Tax=Nocardia cyriacigeorgica TaxID=135487 RepID=UPI002455FEA3|nr:hypothetical protein [Nocardia cyriacigeorgica]
MITYTTLVRESTGLYERNGERFEGFRTVMGPERAGEVWAPGPMRGTVWVLDPAAPGGAVVVDVKTNRQREYALPELPGPRTVTYDEYNAARAVVDAKRAHTAWKSRTWYKSDPEPENPGDEAVREAERVVETWERETSDRNVFLEAANAPRPVTAKLFRELTSADVIVCLES